MQNSEDIAREIRVQLARRNLSEAWLAGALGISRQTLRRRMKGETPWRFAELAVMHQRWDVDFDVQFNENHTHAPNST